MHHTLTKPLTAEEALLQKIMSLPLFRSERGLSLFLEVHRWYFVATTSRRMPDPVLREVVASYKRYQACGEVPAFFHRIPNAYAKEITQGESPSRGKHIPPDDSRLRQVLLGIVASYRSKNNNQLLEHDSGFWLLVFEEYFQLLPEGDDDPLWDTLFAAGIPLLRTLQTASP